MRNIVQTFLLLSIFVFGFYGKSLSTGVPVEHPAEWISVNEIYTASQTFMVDTGVMRSQMAILQEKIDVLNIIYSKIVQFNLGILSFLTDSLIKGLTGLALIIDMSSLVPYAEIFQYGLTLEPWMILLVKANGMESLTGITGTHQGLYLPISTQYEDATPMDRNYDYYKRFHMTDLMYERAIEIYMKTEPIKEEMQKILFAMADAIATGLSSVYAQLLECKQVTIRSVDNFIDAARKDAANWVLYQHILNVEQGWKEADAAIETIRTLESASLKSLSLYLGGLKYRNLTSTIP